METNEESLFTYDEPTIVTGRVPWPNWAGDIVKVKNLLF